MEIFNITQFIIELDVSKKLIDHEKAVYNTIDIIISVFIHIFPDVTPTQVGLYDLQGRMVRSQRNDLENLNLQGLSSGTYTMHVTLENGKVFSDKVVKN